MRRFLAGMTLRELMIAIASIALVLALLRVEIVRDVLIFFGPPVIGAILHRRSGGRGILGGAIGGLLAYCGWVVSVYVWNYLLPDPSKSKTDYIGPELVFLLVAVFGSFVGVVIWIIALCIANSPTKKSVIDQV